MSNPILLLITRPHDPHYQSYRLDHRYYPAEAALFENKRRSIWCHIFSWNKNIPCPQTIKNLKSNLYLYLRSWNCLKGIQSKLCNKCIWRNIPLVSSSPSPLIPKHFILHALYFFLIFILFLKLYNIVLVLPNIEMNPPQVYPHSPSWTLFPPPSPTLPLGRPSAPAPSIQYHALNLDTCSIFSPKIFLQSSSLFGLFFSYLWIQFFFFFPHQAVPLAPCLF